MLSRLRSEFFILVLALQFLTRLPVPTTNAYSSERMSASVRYYPLIGLLIGLIAAATYVGSLIAFPELVAIFLSTIVTALVTGGFHEDGLADTFDGIGGGLTRERSLEIMKDSRVGVFGLLALTLTIATKVATLVAMDTTTVVVALVAAHCLSRWSSVMVIASSRYVRDHGTGKPTAESIGRTAFGFTTLTAILALAMLYLKLSPAIAAAALVGLIVSHVFIRLFFERKIGGYTGDCLGATQQVSEVGIYLGILACQ